MNNTTDYLNSEIYPALFRVAGTALPEFDFKEIRGNYVSTSGAKVTGEEGKQGKVYLYANNPAHLIDYSRDPVSIWDYIQRRDNLSDQDTLKKLASLAGVTLPELDQETQEKYQRNKTQAQIWEDANSFFIYCLHNSKDKTAQDILAYLTGRGYTAGDIEIMELGYIPAQDRLVKHLTETRKHDKTQVEDTIKLVKPIGSTHYLTIPLRASGKLQGIGVRSIDPQAETKYLYNTGLSKSKELFNLSSIKGDKDLVIVEGLLDSLIATARGIDNVIALGSASLTSEQIATAKRYGAKKITLCLDNDTAGKAGTINAITLLLDQDLRVFVGTLPESIKDPDELIKKHGADAFKTVISKAEPYYKYFLLSNILSKYSGKAELTPKEADTLQEEVITFGQKIASPLDRSQYIKYFTDLVTGITPESLQDTIEKVRYKAEEEKKGKELRELQTKARDLQDKGEHGKAIELLEEGLKTLKVETAKEMIPVYGFSDWRQEMYQNQPSLKTGINKLDEMLRIPQGAITLLMGRTSHGKTTLMFNLLLAMSAKYGHSKKFYFFSYEEQKKNILTKILNQ